MAESTPPDERPLRTSAEAFRARQGAGKPSVVRDVRGPKGRDRGETTIPGALRACPEIRIDPSRLRDRLILT